MSDYCTLPIVSLKNELVVLKLEINESLGLLLMPSFPLISLNRKTLLLQTKRDIGSINDLLSDQLGTVHCLS